MRHPVKRLAATALLGVMAVSLAALPLGGADRTAYETGPPGQAEKWQQPLAEKQKIELLLNRITFGPRPGDVERVEQMGLNNFLEQQLHPRTLDDSTVEARLQGLQTLEMAPAELAVDFPPPMQAKLIEQRRLAALERQGASPATALRPGFRRFGSAPAPDQVQNTSRNAASNTAPSATQNEAQSPMQGEAGAAMMTAQRDQAATQNALQARMQGPREIIMQLGQQEMLRAVYSQRQLQEVMVHFWMNHFNIYWPKGADRYYLTSFEQDVIRPRALGNFEDLLVATAESPAMLFYLDNWLSVSPNQQNAPFFRQPLPGAFRPFGPGSLAQPKKAQARRGLNENYGRELMELHTIGLHYTQQDVTEVARCFTGWTIQRPGQGGGFYFNPRTHDYGKKVVLGYTIPAGQGIEDGLEVLHILAMSPLTAQHLAYQLCQRFVADNPPPDLVNRAAKTYLQTHGDIRSVLKTILTSPEFYSQGAYQAKVKSPFQYVASALRALNAETDGGMPLLGAMAQMGEPVFLYEAPSGYDDVANTWINSSSLLMRMNFAIALGLGRIRGTEVDWQAIDREEAGKTPRQMISRLAEQLTGGGVSPATETAILDKLTRGDPADWGDFRPGQQTRMVASLMIASPEFQKR
jgi:uncharacterized protein (DUF1800 family)